MPSMTPPSSSPVISPSCKKTTRAVIFASSPPHYSTGTTYAFKEPHHLSSQLISEFTVPNQTPFSSPQFPKAPPKPKPNTLNHPQPLRIHDLFSPCLSTLHLIQLFSFSQTPAMPFFYSKNWGGKHFGGGVIADKNGVRRAPWRFRIGKFNCFR